MIYVVKLNPIRGRRSDERAAIVRMVGVWRGPNDITGISVGVNLTDEAVQARLEAMQEMFGLRALLADARSFFSLKHPSENGRGGKPVQGETLDS